MDRDHIGSVNPAASSSSSTYTSSPSHQPTSSESQPEAGPSRPRRTTLPSPNDRGDGSGDVQDVDESHTAGSPTPRIDLATYPTQTLLRLLAGLLSQIATANDHLRQDVEMRDTGTAEPALDSEGDHPPSPAPPFDLQAHISAPPQTVQAPSPTSELFADDSSASKHITPDPDNLYTAARTSIVHSASLLAFHARHVPSITIESYLLRILKYCPTTNEVFISLLVYFDRMSRLGTPEGVGGTEVPLSGMGKGFAIDSYNVHRLVIAGVTVASKFFSDVFYTNSRYAKVGGLPSHELNQLELQFLLLNNFRLMVPPEEMQRYGDRLLGYWHGRESEVGVDSVFPPTGTSATGTQVKTTDAKPRSERSVRMQSPEKTSKRPSIGPASADASSQAMEVDPSASRPPVPMEATTASAPLNEPLRAATSNGNPAPPSALQHGSSPTKPKSKTEPSSTETSAAWPSATTARSGLGEWARSDPVIEAVGNRMASPMRD